MVVKSLFLHQIGKKSFIMVYEASSFPFVIDNRCWLDILVSLGTNLNREHRALLYFDLLLKGSESAEKWFYHTVYDLKHL